MTDHIKKISRNKKKYVSMITNCHLHWEQKYTPIAILFDTIERERESCLIYSLLVGLECNNFSTRNYSLEQLSYLWPTSREIAQNRTTLYWYRRKSQSFCIFVHNVVIRFCKKSLLNDHILAISLNMIDHRHIMQ